MNFSCLNPKVLFMSRYICIFGHFEIEICTHRPKCVPVASLHLGLFCHKFWVGGIWKEPFVTHRALPLFPGKSNLASSLQIVVYIFCCSAFLEKLSFLITRTGSVSYAGEVDGNLRGRATERYFYKDTFDLGKTTSNWAC